MSTRPSAPERTPWHSLPQADVAARLGSDSERGLSHPEAAARLAREGPNALAEAGRRSPLAMLAAQFTDFMILVLIAAAVVAGLVGEPQDSIAIVVIVLLNGAMGFVQEYRAERALAALRRMASPQARAIRNGQPTLVDARALVPGDLVELEAGSIVPADLRLVELAALGIDESALTGESQGAEKRLPALDDRDLPLGERRNLAYKGTVVTHGRARGLVVETGMRTEIGRIAGLLSADYGRTPLQQRLSRFGRQLALAVLAICAVIFIAGWLRGTPPLTMLLTAISLAVAAIPEALPAVVTIALALGAARMVRQNALIRRLPAVETLGSVTTICTDKTGTLTENRMRVECLQVGDDRHGALPAALDSPWRELGRVMALCNDAGFDAAGRAVGDPTEIALLEAAAAVGLHRPELEQRHPRLAELPFEAARARMSSLHGDAAGVLVLVKGAPEAVLPRCADRLSAGGEAALDVAAELARAEAMAGEGLRVLALAQRRVPALPESLDAEAVETGLRFLGLVGLIDPPRAEAGEAVVACREAGIVPIMITGDHPATARAIALRLGIATPDDIALTGRELERLDAAAFEREIGRVRVYARIDPAQKLRIVQALQARGEFVAMTGDGVNDAPALKAADIGVAMGRSGTDVAREAAHMSLLDDNFATIVLAVREGRRIYDNIRKFVRYTMTSNSGEIWTIVLAPFLGLPIPLLPIHILWINLVTDGLPGLALASERGEADLMRRPPRPPRESLFAHGLWQHALWVGLLMGLVCLLTQAWAIHVASAHWQSMVFTVLTLSQLGHVLAVRSERQSLFQLGIASNPLLLGTVLVTVALQMAVLYLPWLQPIFRTEALDAGELAFCFALSSIVFVAVELEKWMMRRGWIHRTPPAQARV